MAAPQISLSNPYLVWRDRFLGLGRRQAAGRHGYADALAEGDGEGFLAMFDDVKDGDELWIRTTGNGQVFVEASGKKRKMSPTSKRLEHDIWDIWLGGKPISTDLKKSVLDRIDTLGR